MSSSSKFAIYLGIHFLNLLLIMCFVNRISHVRYVKAALLKRYKNLRMQVVGQGRTVLPMRPLMSVVDSTFYRWV